MAQIELTSLVDYLRRGTPRTRVGLWCAPLSKIGKEAETAIQLGIQPLDVGKYYLERLPKGAQFARLSSQKVIETLDSIASSMGQSDCVLVFNFDLLLSGLKTQERQQVWLDLFNHFPNRRRALIIVLPDTAKHLLPTEELLENWQRETRVVQ